MATATRTSLQLRCVPFQPCTAHCRVSTVLRHQRLAVVAKAKKGFGGGDDDSSQLKVNERGKVSSRTGPVSKKQLDKIKADGEAKKQQMQAQQQAVAEPPRVPGAPDAMPMRETPQVVVDRMLKRIFMFTGVPVGLGLALLPLFYYLKVGLKVDYPIWVVYIAQTLTFGGALFGITYGIISSSWEPGREGSFWGWTEARANLPLLLNRNKKQ